MHQAMDELKAIIPYQKRKLTSRPTIHKTFQFFNSILLLYIRDITSVPKKVINKKEYHDVVNKVLGENAGKI